MSTASPKIEDFINREYDAGFVTDIEADSIPPGLDEDVVRRRRVVVTVASVSAPNDPGQLGHVH